MAVEAAAALLFATAVSDALGLAGASFSLLVLAVPVSATAGLVCLARVVDAMNEEDDDPLGRVQVALSGLLVAAIVVGAAARAPATGQAGIPHAASVALAFGFLVLLLQALVALAARPARR